MRSMAIRRRQLLLGLLAAGAGLRWLPRTLAAPAEQRFYLSARADAAGQFRVSGFTPDGRPHFDLELPARGHSFAVSPEGDLAVHFARRPGTFAKVIDLERGTIERELQTPVGRHFCGHGVFAPRDRLLYATENDFSRGRGVVGVYDAGDAFRRVAELPSHGIGPHELRLLPDGTTLAVANGGILTHPDVPRTKLNLPTMAPSLDYVDRRSGKLLRKVRLPPELHQLSIRHLTVAPDGRVAIAMQYEGSAGDRVPLIASHRGQESLQLFAGPEDVLRAMKHYCGSTTLDAGGTILAVSAPRGNILTFWELSSGTYLSSVPVADGCGVAPAAQPGHFLASSGEGGVVIANALSAVCTPVPSDFLRRGRWDNHMQLAHAAGRGMRQDLRGQIETKRPERIHGGLTRPPGFSI